jgi:hypothetical protein
MTLTPDPLSTKIPAMFCLPMMAFILGHSQSITRSSTSVSCIAVASVSFVPFKVRRIPSRNLGTNRNSCSSVIVTCIPAKSEMLGSVLLLDGPVASVRVCLPFAVRWFSWVRISSFCRAFASSTHCCAYSRRWSCFVHCSMRARLRVMTNCTAGVIKLTAGP